jgi:threonine/homoserine/homoserine lactone efflux protein
LTELLSLATFLLFGTFTPGANTAVSTMLGANYGAWRAMPFISGVAIAFGLIYALCIAGVGALIQTTPWLRSVLVWGGLAYMLWLAYKIATATAIKRSEEAKPLHAGHGFTNCMLNPKVWMLAIAVAAQFALQSAAWHVWAALLFVVFGFASNAAWAVVGSSLRAWLEQGTRLRWFNRAMGAALAVTAVWITWNAQMRF